MHQQINFLEIQSFGKTILRWQPSGERLGVAPREETLTIYLAYRQAPVTRSELCSFFWPDEPTNRARGNLRKLLTDMRKSIGDVIQSDREQIWFSEEHYWFDLHEFQRLTQSLARDPKRTKPLTEAEINHLREGLRLYHGDFMAHVKTPQSPHVAAWLEQEQRIWQQRAIVTCGALIDHAIVRRELAKATTYVRRLLELDPFHEGGHSQLIRLLAHQEQTAEAIAHYEQYCMRSYNELDGIEEEELTELYQQIRVGIIPPLTTGLTSALVFEGQSKTTSAQPIPTPVTPLIGRIDLLDKLDGYLQNPAVRLITLVGLGGIGKSRTALALAERAQHEYHNALAYVALERWLTPLKSDLIAGDQSYTLLTTATADALGLSREAADPPLDQLISRHLQRQRFVLFLDNFESVIEGAHFVLQLLQEAPTTKIVVTSRELLQLPGEVVIKIEGLPWSSLAEETCAIEQKEYIRELDDLVATTLPPAIELFINSAQRHQPHLTFTQTQLEQVAEICALLDGNPLAIEMAASLVAHYSYDELVALLGDNLQSLQTIGRGRLRRHHSIQEVLEESWRLLSKPEQRALTQLTLLPRNFHRARAVQMDGISPNILIGLTAKSMLQPTGQGSYQLPHLVQLFAAQKRQQNGGSGLGIER